LPQLFLGNFRGFFPKTFQDFFDKNRDFSGNFFQFGLATLFKTYLLDELAILTSPEVLFSRYLKKGRKIRSEFSTFT
jgi:hypothetical protein